MPPGRMLLNAFSMNCVSHIQHGLWVRSDTRQLEYTQLAPWIELAQLLEKGRFDALFLADVIGVYDTYHGGPEASIAEGMQIPVNDPALLIPAMANAEAQLPGLFTQLEGHKQHRRRGVIMLVTGRCGHHGLSPPW
jgi:hypothetical protein